MTEPMPVNNGASESAPAASATAQNLSQEYQNEVGSNANATPAEAVNTDNREQMIPRARFDQVNRQLNQFKERQKEFEAYEQFSNILESDPDLVKEIEGVFEKRKQVSRPENPVNTRPQADPVVQQLAQKVYLMQANESVRNYKNDFEAAAKRDGIDPVHMNLYRDNVERTVIAKLKGDISNYDPQIFQQAYTESKQYLDSFLKQSAPVMPNLVPNIPVTKPNPPIEVKRFKTNADRTSFIANGLRASKGSS